MLSDLVIEHDSSSSVVLPSLHCKSHIFFAARICGLCPLQKTFDLKQRNKDMGSMCLLLEYCINTVVLPAKVGSTDCDQDDLRMTLL